jgi:hypothetical protein
MSNQNTKWIPEIFYEENPDGLTSHVPFINIPEGEEMPDVLFFFGVKKATDTKQETENVFDITLHSYYNSNTVKETLTPEEFAKLKSRIIMQH